MADTDGRPARANPALAALKAVSLAHQLTVEALQSRSLPELAFRIVNRTHVLTPYDRAVLILHGRRGGRVLAISGLSKVEESAWPVRWLARTSGELPRSGAARELGEDALAALPDFESYRSEIDPGHVAWAPLMSTEGPGGGLWLERRNKPWSEGELALLDQLAVPFAEMLRIHGPRPAASRLALAAGRRPALMALALAVLLVAVRVPLRVVAPCELAPEAPFPVTAPLAGVIEQALVEPGQPVEAGQPLFEYDKRVAMEELNLARQQVRLLESSLARSRMQAFGDPKAKAEIALLEIKLEQERIRLSVSEYNASRLQVTAVRDGVVAMDDPDQWRGRPVAVGERLLTLVDPARVKLRIWLPVDDNLPFEPDAPVTAYLSSLPDTALKARLTFVAKNVSQSPEGFLGVAAEARFDAPPEAARLGVQGTAVLSGPRVSLAYWLMRRPLAWARGFLGV